MKESDPRWSRIFPDSSVSRMIPPPILREVPAPTGPREVRLQNRQATVFPNIRMHPNLGTQQSEMSAAAHPSNPDRVLTGANTFTSSNFVASQGWYYTADGGAAWSGGDTLPTHTNFGFYMSDPAVGLDLDGNLLFNALLYRPGSSADVVLVRSSNQGVTWAQTAVPSPSRGKDKNHLVVDVNPGSPFKNYLYTAYTDFDLLNPYQESPIRFSRSMDGGVTLTPPIPISGGIGNQFAQGINLAVGPKGELYAAWSGYDDFFSPQPQITRLGFNKSTDGGGNWHAAQSIDSVLDIRGFLNKGVNSIRVNSFPSMAVNRSNGSRRGWIYVVYPQRAPTTPDIFLVRSSDDGATWSNPRRVNQDASDKDQWFPWISVDPATGHLYIVYYDSRNFPANDSAQVFISSSMDGGETFEDILVSDAAFLPAPIPGLAPGYSGDYIGISALNGVVWPSWNDNRTGIHQAYTSRMVFLEVGSPPKISVSPDTMDFKEVFLGYPETLSVSMHNLGYPDTLFVNSILSDHPDFAPESASFSLSGGSIQKLKVAFNPSGAGPAAASLTIISNDPASPSVSVGLKGTGVYPPALATSPDSLAFTLNENDSATAVITMADTGVAALSFSIQVQEAGSGSASKFSPASFAPEVAVGPRILLLAADDDGLGYVSDVRSKLLATGRFSWIDVMDVSVDGSTPKLTQLQPYDAVLVWSYQPFRDPVVLGNLLADYVDGGGGVVTALYALEQYPYYPDNLIKGRFHAQNYWAIQPGVVAGGVRESLGTIYVPGHPTIQNVVTFDGGINSDRRIGGGVASGAILIADWSDGSPLVAVKTINGRNRVDLGFFPPSSDAFRFWWLSATDGAVMMANALEYAAAPAFVTATPTSGTVLPGGRADIEVKIKTNQLDGGTSRVNILIFSNDPDEPVDTVPVQLTVIGTPRLGLSEDTLDFGDAIVNYPDTLTLTLSNNGTDLLKVTGMAIDNPRFSVLDSTEFDIPQYQTREVHLALSPSFVGLEMGTLSIFSNDTARPTAILLLRANVVHPPALSVSPGSFAFTLNMGDSATGVLTIADTGLGPLFFSIKVQGVNKAPVSPVCVTNRAGQLPPIVDVEKGSHSVVKPGASESEPGLALVSFASTGAVGPKILILAADFPDYVADVGTKLSATGRFSSVDIMDASFYGSSPTLAQLEQYDAVLVWSNIEFFDPVGIGDLLADYVDGGGGLVTALFAMLQSPIFDNDLIKGRFNDQNYWAIQPADFQYGRRATLGTIYLPGHPTIQNVNTLDGGQTSFRLSGATISSGATLVASWSDGEPLVAVKTVSGKNRVDLGFFPPSSDAAPPDYFWLSTTDGTVLIANALEYVTASAAVTVAPSSGTAPPGGSANMELKIRTDRLNVGVFQANLIIFSNDPVHPSDTVLVSVTVRCAAAKGDLNGDTLFTITDVVLQLNCVFLAEGLCAICLTDLNCSGGLSPADVVLELFQVFLYQNFPCP